jgi:hypothetical protein
MKTNQTIEGALRKCSKCQRLLPIEQFSVRKNGQPQSWCKSCTNEQTRMKNKLRRAEEVLKEKPHRMPLTAEEDPEERRKRINHVKEVVREIAEKARAKRIQGESDKGY